MPEHEPYPDLESRIRFLGITDGDLARLRRLLPVFEEFADEFVEQFYDHLFSEEVTSSFLKDSKLVERLKRKQKQHFASMLGTELTAEYSQDRNLVGMAHAEVGLDPHWFLGSFCTYMQVCLPRFAKRVPANELQDTTLSLIKIIILDISLTMRAYFAQSTKQLHSALELLESSNAGLKEFANLVSHDLRTPIATIAALCEEVLDEFGSEVPAEAQQLLKSARTKTMNMGRMLDELLEAASSSPLDDQPQRAATRVLLDEVVEQIRGELAGRDLEIDIPDQLPDVLVHPAKLREVFYNLLANAVKFHDKPGGKIWVSGEQTSTSCVFCVGDNGPGMPAPDATKVFAPFHRLPEHRGLPGSGLGLHFVKTIVEQRGGEVWIKSVVGQGTEVFFELPRAD